MPWAAKNTRTRGATRLRSQSSRRTTLRWGYLPARSARGRGEAGEPVDCRVQVYVAGAGPGGLDTFDLLGVLAPPAVSAPAAAVGYPPTTPAAVAVGWWCSTLGRSSRPSAPNWRWRCTQLLTQARAIPISAATWEIGRVWYRSTRRRGPRRTAGRYGHRGRVLPVGGCVGGTSHPAAEDPSASLSPSSAGVYNITTRNS